MPTALITGISGQDGWYLSEHLLADGYHVVGLDPAAGDAPLPPGTAAVRGDLRDEASLRAALAGTRPQEIYNLAGLSSVAQSWEQPEQSVDVNGLGVLRLLRAMRDTVPTARFVQAGSAEIFGTAPAPQDEDTAVRPTSPYGAGKALAHQFVTMYRTTGLHAANAILFNHESPRRPQRFVTRKITAAVARIASGSSETLELGDLSVRRDWGHARDYCAAMVAMARAEPGDFVIASGQSHTVAEFVAAAFAHAGIEDWQPFVRVDPDYARPNDPGELRGDAARAHAVLGWRPRSTFADLVAEMVDADLRRVRQGSRPQP
ncbi:MAG: GDP-mannose 4,6-dehydratase [Jatrophihabitans sp.]|nr:MAG: GDP-mannose 4,6-dehydratase [Jatrophihabitans sp.]